MLGPQLVQESNTKQRTPGHEYAQCPACFSCHDVLDKARGAEDSKAHIAVEASCCILRDIRQTQAAAAEGSLPHKADTTACMRHQALTTSYSLMSRPHTLHLALPHRATPAQRPLASEQPLRQAMAQTALTIHLHIRMQLSEYLTPYPSHTESCHAPQGGTSTAAPAL